MNVAITGHTTGIGKELYNLYPDASVFSKSTGYDISNIEIQSRIIEEIKDCDVFINNAHSGWSQIDLLYKIWWNWQDLPKTIVSIGSMSSDYRYPQARPYAVYKGALEDTCLQLQQSNKLCRAICIKPGHVDTPRVENMNVPKIDPADLAKFVKEIIEMRRSFWIPVISIHPILPIK